MIVTIDGPAGAGKSSTARQLAQRLGFRFLDTGAMYRAAALAARRAQADWCQVEALVELIRAARIELTEQSVLLDGDDVTQEIRSPEVTADIHHVADQPQIREILVRLQRKIAATEDYVTEGRDQGTVVFPDADCKIFLTATPEERARRRARQQQASGEPADWQAILQQQTERDRRDTSRAVGKLLKAEDAIEFITDGLSEQQVVDQLETLVRQRLELGPRASAASRNAQ